MNPSTFTVIGEPTRLRILGALQAREMGVNDLVLQFNSSQPTISKHLKVLRDAGFVTCRVDAQRRIYRLDNAPLQAIDSWLEPYRAQWTKSLDRLETMLDEEN